MRVLLLSKYGRLGASSRVRSLQYIPYLSERGFAIDVCPLFADRYLTRLYASRNTAGEVFLGYLRRLGRLLRVSSYDVIWVEKEIFPFFPAIAERILSILGIPYMVDYDDALFHRYDLNKSAIVRTVLGRKIDVVMRYANLVVAGNDYLAGRARIAGARRVEIVPTVVDTDQYAARAVSPDTDSVVVGWIGTPKTSKYLNIVAGAAEQLKQAYGERLRFVAIGAERSEVRSNAFEFLPWQESTEVSSLQALDIGIMPLEDSPWERGKCGYKLIQYMACGVPVVGSPVGVNSEIVEHGQAGYLAREQSEWRSCLSSLIDNRGLRMKMGATGRQRVEKMYSLVAHKDRLESLLISAAERRSRVNSAQGV